MLSKDELYHQNIQPLKQNFGKHKLVLNTYVVVYTIFGYFLGLYLILLNQAEKNLLGMILITHTSIWSALLTHEFIHETIFEKRSMNRLFGSLMTLISGACYVSFKLLKQQHIKHHCNKVGYDGFSITSWVLSLPASIRAVLITLEFFYIPVLSFISRWRTLLVPLLRPDYKYMRLRIVIVFLIRVTFFSILYLINPWSILYVFLAHIAMLNILRVYDCYHHTFDIIPLGSPVPRLTNDYEQENTFSSLINRKYYWTNWIFLNYGYHNAHHYKPNVPWHELPNLDKAMYPSSEVHCILFPDLIIYYHRNRINRIYKGLGSPTVKEGKLQINKFWGIIMNISFIVYDV
ncbi:MAG: fatty acid desaturase [Nostoc sp.]|uniref:fatty acid desaturase family protein n=1 Tax=Nostoc sp. TaxID=1180 RepID=UPI002FF550BC